MTDQQPRHVFISYVRENQEQVDRLCQELEQHGVKVWLDRKSIKPGARWKDAIREAIRHGDFFIACFSKEYTSRQKNFMNEELTLAIEELRQFASDREWFIPVLLSECDVPARSIGAGETLLDINWVPLYEDWDAGIQRILSVIKPISLEIQDLISASRSENVHIRAHAISELGKIGDPAAVPTLIEALPGGIFDIDSIASEGLSRIGGPAVPALIEALKNENRNVRASASRALGLIGPIAKAVVPSLIKALKDQSSGVRCWAVWGLEGIGPEAKAALPALIKALKDEDENVRYQVALTLANIYSEEKIAMPILIDALKGENENYRRRAAKALGTMGQEAKKAVPSLIEASKDDEEDVRKAAAQALKKINTPEALKALEEYKQKSK